MSGKEVPNEVIEKEGVLYYKNRLYILDDESQQTEIAQGSRNSLVAGPLDKKKQSKH